MYYSAQWAVKKTLCSKKENFIFCADRADRVRQSTATQVITTEVTSLQTHPPPYSRYQNSDLYDSLPSYDSVTHTSIQQTK